MLEKGDILVIAGKGHEQGQIFADRVDPFDDVDEAHSAMQEAS
jgi:UDP-N-acetylmuramoyl-L-alanyl-D-glutamate--2,6-diaminopimelate ligase